MDCRDKPGNDNFGFAIIVFKFSPWQGLTLPSRLDGRLKGGHGEMNETSD
jgi:hypothetical protein